MNNKLVFSLDVGSSKIVSMVGAIAKDKINILGFSCDYFNQGPKNDESKIISNGLVCVVERVGHKINQVLHEAQINADCSRGSVISNISGNHLRNIYSSSELELNGGIVDTAIVSSLVRDAIDFKLPNGYELLDYEVQEYEIDNANAYSADPIGLHCDLIKSNVNLFVTSKAYLNNLKKSIKYSQFDILKILPSAILSAMAVLNDEEKNLGSCLIDIGAGTTDIVVYESGYVRFMASLPIGGEDITRDIASVLRVSRNLAEDLKLSYGSCSFYQAKSDGINIIDHRGNSVNISNKLLNDVITARVREIVKVIKDQLINEGLYDIISSGFIITGGSAQLDGISEFSSKLLDAPVRIGTPHYVGDFADIICNPRYASAYGGLLFVQDMFTFSMLENDANNSGIEFGKILQKIKNIFKNI